MVNMEDDKLDMLNLFVKSVGNPQDGDRIGSLFNFSANKEEAVAKIKSFQPAKAQEIADFPIESDGHRADADIDRFLAAIKAAKFKDDKVEVARAECEQHPSPPFEAHHLLRILAEYAFSDDCMAVLTLFAGPAIVYPIVCADVVKILDIFKHSQDKIAVLPSLKPFIKDAQNKLGIVASFTFSDDKTAAEEILRDVVVKFVPPTPPAAAIQQALKKVGRCPAGYQWRQVQGGWRCAAGGHFVSDAKVSQTLAEMGHAAPVATHPTPSAAPQAPRGQASQVPPGHVPQGTPQYPPQGAPQYPPQQGPPQYPPQAAPQHQPQYPPQYPPQGAPRYPPQAAPQHQPQYPPQYPPQGVPQYPPQAAPQHPPPAAPQHASAPSGPTYSRDQCLAAIRGCLAQFPSAQGNGMQIAMIQGQVCAGFGMTDKDAVEASMQHHAGNVADAEYQQAWGPFSAAVGAAAMSMMGGMVGGMGGMMSQMAPGDPGMDMVTGMMGGMGAMMGGMGAMMGGGSPGGGFGGAPGGGFGGAPGSPAGAAFGGNAFANDPFFASDADPFANDPFFNN